MNRLLKAINRLSELIVPLTKVTITAMMGLMTIVIIYQVFMRYVLKGALPWSEEFSRYLMAWVAFLGASFAVKTGGHIGLEIVVKNLPDKVRCITITLTGLVIIIFLAIIAKEGYYLSNELSFQRSPAMRVSMFWPYLSIPVGCTLMILHMLPIFLEQLIDTVSLLKKVK